MLFWYGDLLLQDRSYAHSGDYLLDNFNFKSILSVRGIVTSHGYSTDLQCTALASRLLKYRLDLMPFPKYYAAKWGRFAGPQICIEIFSFLQRQTDISLL